MEQLEFRDPDQMLRQYHRRLALLAIIVLVVFGVYVVRLFYLQVIRYDYYHSRAEDNRIYVSPVPSPRGEILAADGSLLAENEPVYSLEVIPLLVPKAEELLDDVSSFINLRPQDRVSFLKRFREYKGTGAISLKVRLSDAELARFAGQSFRYPSLALNVQFLRSYPHADSTVHVVGYLGTLSEKDREQIEENFLGNDYLGETRYGKSGLEKNYESLLHGAVGSELVEVDSFGRTQRQLKMVKPELGKSLRLSIDLGLQEVAAQALAGRRGAVVAMEPDSGRVLALVSSPSFNPEDFFDGISTEQWQSLNSSADRPLLNRAVGGTYPPGSTFKPYMALAALSKGFRKPTDITYDPGYYQVGDHTYRDFDKKGHGAVDMYRSIVLSCDTYYYKLAQQMGIDDISQFAGMFGFGQLTGVELPEEVAGVLPSRAWKEKRFPKQKSWVVGDTIPLGVGQGFHAYTPIQMATAVSAIANGGVLREPRLVDGIISLFPKSYEQQPPSPSSKLPINPKDLAFIQKSMAGVNKEGTAATVFVGAAYTSAGKTGTAQVFDLKGGKYEHGKIKEALRDHALYVGFAPLEAPKIAVVVVVENAGFGATAAAPVARKMMDYYLIKPKSEAPKNETFEDDRR